MKLKEILTVKKKKMSEQKHMRENLSKIKETIF